MLFPLASVMEPKYNLKCTKCVIWQITNCLNFDQPITYSNLETTLSSMYESHASRMDSNISRKPAASTPFANLDEDHVELNLFKGIRDERYNARGSSSSMYPAYNSTSNASSTGVPAELFTYFKHQNA